MANGQNVDLAVLLNAGLDDLVEVLVVGGIGGGVGAVDALGNELVLQSLQLLGVAAGHEDLGTGVAVSLGQDAAQSAGSAGDQSNLAFNGEHSINEILLNGNHSKFLLKNYSLRFEVEVCAARDQAG